MTDRTDITGRQPEDRLKFSHPCFGHPANAGRIHLPVAAGCNITCNFCIRSLDAAGDRPAVARKIIRPGEANGVIAKSLELLPQIRVVGIAGPGEPLAGPAALETFRLVKKAYPGLLRCLSTNGLLLHEKAGEIKDAGIDALTVTVNAIDADIQSKICSRVDYRGRRYEGAAGARLLIKNQLMGLREFAGGPAALKVNTVLIPGVNDRHIPEIARAMGDIGVTMYNIIPLIPQFKLAEYPEPSCEAVNRARAAAEPYVPIFRHCQRCRADAIGIPGEIDIAGQVYLQQMNTAGTFSHG